MSTRHAFLGLVHTFPRAVGLRVWSHSMLVVLFVFCGFAALQAGLVQPLGWAIGVGLQRLVLIACRLAVCFLGVFVSCGLR